MAKVGCAKFCPEAAAGCCTPPPGAGATATPAPAAAVGSAALLLAGAGTTGDSSFVLKVWLAI